MKNRISTLIATLAVATCAQAQWTPDDKAYNIVGQDSIYGQVQMKALRTADGKTVLTWLNTPQDMRYDNPDFGYYLYMQTFDADGKPLLGKNGKIISQKPTKSYTTDYGMQLTADGNIVISYTDTRNDAAKKQNGENYLYCYTPEGEPVWDKEGIKIVSATSRPNYNDMVPTLCVSGNSLYGMIDHIERYRVKADASNWEPSPWDPDEEMPDSIDASSSDYQIMRYSDNGTQAWTSPIRLASSDVWTSPAPDGGLYLIYINKGYGIDARRIDKDGNDVWTEPVNVESGTVTDGSYTTPPTILSDGKGGLMLVYRKLLSYSGYLVANHLTPEGTVYDDEFIINGTQDGDSNNPVAAVNGNRLFTAFSYTPGGEQNLWINQLDIDGDYTWDGDNLLGYSYDENDMWGLKAVDAIAQSDGWVLLYGNAQSWNGADFYVAKIDFNGNTVWKKQIAESNFKSSGFATVNDDSNVYIFYTCDKEIGDDWEEIPGKGGMRVMCVDITGKTTGINATCDTTSNAKTIYNAEGMMVGSMSQPGLYIVKDGGTTKKIVKK